MTTATTSRWELLRALAAVADSPDAARAVAPALGLPAPTAAEHTHAFVLNAAPYASIYLGPDGALGGEGADRTAGFWRALTLPPPAEPDHLTTLLTLYTHLGHAAEDTHRETTRTTLITAQAALLTEHLWPWLPPYLDAIADLGQPALTAWAELTRQAVTAEYRTHPPARALPLALRAAPPPISPEDPLSDLIDALTAPIRSGIFLTRHHIITGAGQAAVGHRIGERRFTLRAMLEQDSTATLTWLTQEATRWQRRHGNRDPSDAVSSWWAARAGHTAQLIQNCAAGSSL